MTETRNLTPDSTTNNSSGKPISTIEFKARHLVLPLQHNTDFFFLFSLRYIVRVLRLIACTGQHERFFVYLITRDYYISPSYLHKTTILCLFHHT